MRTSLVSGAAAGFVLIVATACGGGTAATTKPAGSVAGPASAPAAASQAAAGGAPTCASGIGTGQQVAAANFAFTPPSSTVSAGGTVSWTNGDSADHTVTFDGGPDCGKFSTTQSVTATFPSAGTYAYHCTIHPQMKGTVTVS